MLSPQEVYPLVLPWVQALGVCPHPTALRALTYLVVALLHGQSLRPSALMRALLSPTATPVPARQRYKRVARALERPWLTPAWLTPRLVPAVLALLPPEDGGGDKGGGTVHTVHVALDSVRCGPWEAFTLGIVWRGRVVPVAWAVLPYPWPKGRVTPTVCALVAGVDAAWPAGRARPHLVADRGFPGQRLFKALRRVEWGWTIRLRAPMPVTVGEGRLRVRDLLGRARPTGWTVWHGAYGQGRTALPATLVVGRGLLVVPAHQRTEGSLRHRAARHAERRRVVGYRYRSVAETDPWMALCTTHATWQGAVRSYRKRWATEGSYRDAQGGWDGQHGWDLEPTLAAALDAGWAERLLGLWALGALLQTFVGAQVQHGPALVRGVAAEWTTTGRLSVWAHGQFALREPSGRLRAWLGQTLRDGAPRLAAARCPSPPAATPRPLRRETTDAHPRAA